MNRLILAAATLATLAAPLAAQADPGDYNRDRQDWHREHDGEHRDGDRRDWHDDRRDAHDDRRDWHDDRHEWRDDRRAEWRAERRYDAGRFYYPRGYGYRTWAVGGFLPRPYWGERYWIGRPVAYGLPYALRGTRWVRVGPDALLIRVYDGAVVRVARGIFY